MTALSQPPPAEPMQQQPPGEGPPPPAEPPGEGPALEHLVRTHHQSVWRLLRYLGADPAEADDLTQETFLAVARSGFTHQGDRPAAAYLRTAARNQLLMLRRKQKRQIDTVAIDAAEGVWAETVEQEGWQGFTDALTECVEKLEGRAAQAIDLSYRQGLGRTDIAQQLDMQPDGVKTLLRRTRVVLKECVERTILREDSE